MLAPNDFRSAAIAASLAHPDVVSAGRGEDAAARVDAVARRVSCCLPAPGEGEGLRRHAARVVAAAFVLFVAGVGTGGAIAIFVKVAYSNPSSAPGWTLPVAAVFSGTGIIAAFGGLAYKRILLSRFLRGRVGDWTRIGSAKPLTVTVEDSATFHKIKLKPEDAGVFVPHPEVGCFRIEGLVCRYVVHAKDVVRITRIVGPSSDAVGVEYAIGSVRLAIAIQPMALKFEIGRQVLNKKTGMIDVVCRALGVDPKLHVS